MSSFIMTAEELSAKYNIALSTLKRNFARSQESLKKKYGITIEKTGRGDATLYTIKDFSRVDPSRAVTLYESIETNLVPASIAAGLLDVHFLVFIGIISSPQRSFRGSYVDLLKYLEIEPITKETIAQAKEVLVALAEKDYIMYMEDKTDPMYFMAAILRKTESDMELEIAAILNFKHFVEGTRKQWIPLMKVYLALHVLQQPCTIKKIADITGLTEYKVRDSLTILVEHNVILKEKVIHQDPISQNFYCLGTQIDINALI